MHLRYIRHILIMTIVLLCIVPFVGSSQNQTQFKLLEPQKSGFEFFNGLDEEKLRNPFNYVYAYNGGGVAVGDINNDGLQDIYMTANMSSSKLFLNKGNMKFEDISEQAGVRTGGWCTATLMVDVNDDGWVDIYVCRSYHDLPEDRENLLFINNKDNTFTESAEAYGLNDPNFSIACSFFDYDLDGDLDLFVANHPRYRLVSMRVHLGYANDPPEKFSNKLFRTMGIKHLPMLQLKRA